MTVGPGTRLGSFEILAPLGSGAMGVLYRAKDLKLGRQVALKVLRADLAVHPERLRRFEQEARSASALSHPNIVHIYDIDTAGDVPYIAMELVEGRTLRALLQDGPLALGHLRKLALQTAEGLARAHEAGIVHRDLKPENLMIDPDDRVRILDFGLAKLGAEGLAGGRDSRMTTLAVQGTRPGLLMGTVEYMSPEQAVARSVDFRSDQFSLGVLLYEMITGRLPFQSDSAPQTLAAIIEKEPAPLSPDVPEGWRRLIDQLLQKRPENRFDSTRLIVRALEDLEPSDSRPRLPPLPPAALNPDPPPVPVRTIGPNTIYHLEQEDSIKERTDAWMRKKVRSRDLSGMEMVRIEGEESWQRLYETELFRKEVPFDGDPQSAAEWRVVKGFLGHLLGFVIANVAVSFAGGVNIGFGIWGIFVVLHGLKVLPHAVSLARKNALPALISDRRGGRLARRVRAKIEQRQERSKEMTTPSSSSPKKGYASPSFLGEVEKVRQLLSRRSGKDKKKLQSEIDRIVASVEEIGARSAELEDQTGVAIRDKLAASEGQVREKLERADRPGDKEVYRRQLEVLQTRRSSIEEALRLLDKLAARKAMAEQQLQQLRLDLTRAEALKADPPELSSRLEEIRLEVEAIEKVDDHLAEISPEARWAMQQALPEEDLGDSSGPVPEHARPKKLDDFGS